MMIEVRKSVPRYQAEQNESDQIKHIEVHGATQQLLPGDWFVIDQHGKVTIYNDYQFQTIFERIPGRKSKA